MANDIAKVCVARAGFLARMDILLTLSVEKIKPTVPTWWKIYYCHARRLQQKPKQSILDVNESLQVFVMVISPGIGYPIQPGVARSFGPDSHDLVRRRTWCLGLGDWFSKPNMRLPQKT